MRQLYKVVNLDCKVDNGSESGHFGDPAVERALAKIEYRPLLRNWQPLHNDRLFLIRDEYNRHLSNHYWEMAEQSHRISACGELKFDHIWCAGRDGLRVDVEHGVVYIGNCVNWGYEYFRWWIENSDVGFECWEGDHAFVCDFGPSQIYHHDIVMMKSPGYNIYGHWLLDLVPQLSLSKYMPLSDQATFVFDNIAPWMGILLDATNVKKTNSYQCRLSEHRRLRMPTGLKNGYALAQPINMCAWNDLRLHFNHLCVGRSGLTHEKIFISRKNWSGQRSLPNASAVEDLMTELGFVIFYPEQHELSEQARILANARYVVGEDGSALHSLIFAPPGTRLGVLMQADRMNLWHAGICDAMGHGIGYFPIDQNDDLAVANLEGIRDFVIQLLVA